MSPGWLWAQTEAESLLPPISPEGLSHWFLSCPRPRAPGLCPQPAPRSPSLRAAPVLPHYVQGPVRPPQHLHRCTVPHKRPPFTVMFKSLSFLTAPFHLSPLHCPPGFSLVARELPKGCAPSLTHHSPRVSLGSVDSARPQKWPQLSAHPCPRGNTDN